MLGTDWERERDEKKGRSSLPFHHETDKMIEVEEVSFCFANRKLFSYLFLIWSIISVRTPRGLNHRCVWLAANLFVFMDGSPPVWGGALCGIVDAKTKRSIKILTKFCLHETLWAPWCKEQLLVKISSKKEILKQKCEQSMGRDLNQRYLHIWSIKGLY